MSDDPGRIYSWPTPEAVCPHSLSWDSCIYSRCEPGTATRTDATWRTQPAQWIVTGRPVGYSSGDAEREWKDLIRAAVPLAGTAQPAGSGLFADFSIQQPSPRATGFAIDNLLDPVLSAVINGQGWFGGHRPNLSWVAAQKRVQAEPGVRLAVLPNPPRLWQGSDADVAFDSAYPDDLPTAGSIDEYAVWVDRHMLRPLPKGAVGVAIEMADAEVNLGDIAGGVIKVLIDGLWPILGGHRGVPHDRRITSMVVRKGISGLNGTAAIKVVGLARQ